MLCIYTLTIRLDNASAAITFLFSFNNYTVFIVFINSHLHDVFKGFLVKKIVYKTTTLSASLFIIDQIKDKAQVIIVTQIASCLSGKIKIKTKVFILLCVNFLCIVVVAICVIFKV